MTMIAGNCMTENPTPGDFYDGCVDLVDVFYDLLIMFKVILLMLLIMISLMLLLFFLMIMVTMVTMLKLFMATMMMVPGQEGKPLCRCTRTFYCPTDAWW